LNDTAPDNSSLTWRFNPDEPLDAETACRFVGSPDRALVKRNPRRSVWRTAVAGDTAYVKEFRSNGLVDSVLERLGRNPAEREWNLLMRLWKWSHDHRPGRLVCPVPLAVGAGGDRSILITREVPDALSLGDYLSGPFARLDPQRRRRVLPELGAALARAMEVLVGAEVSSPDLHPGNFLVTATADDRLELVILDLHQAAGRQVRPGLAGAAPGGLRIALVWMNHAVRPLLGLTDRLRILRGFERELTREHDSPHAAELRVRLAEAGSAGDIEHETDRFDYAFHRRRDARCDRDSRYFHGLTAGGHSGSVLLALKRPQDIGSSGASLTIDMDVWRRVLADPAALATAGTVLKDSRSVLVRAMEIPELGRTVVFKKPRRRKWVNMLLDCFRPSRPRTAWRLGHALLARGLPTAVPLAVMERSVLGYPSEAYLLTEHLPDSMHLGQFVRTRLPALEEPRRTQVLRDLVRRLARLLRKLHDEGFVHRDFKAENILVQSSQADDRPQLYLVDMDGIRFNGEVSQRYRLRGLMRAAASSLSLPGVSHTDRARFLAAYLDDLGKPAPDWRSLWRAVSDLVDVKLAGSRA